MFSLLTFIVLLPFVLGSQEIQSVCYNHVDTSRFETCEAAGCYYDPYLSLCFNSLEHVNTFYPCSYWSGSGFSLYNRTQACLDHSCPVLYDPLLDLTTCIGDAVPPPVRIAYSHTHDTDAEANATANAVWFIFIIFIPLLLFWAWVAMDDQDQRYREQKPVPVVVVNAVKHKHLKQKDGRVLLELSTDEEEEER